MHSTASPRAIDLNETVRSILSQKSHAVWSISPETADPKHARGKNEQRRNDKGAKSKSSGHNSQP